MAKELQMIRTKWVDRKFSFNIPKGWLFNILTRLEGTIVRLKSLTNTLSDEQLSEKPNSEWSIKEHIGHLLDLEELHLGRVYDFIDRKTILSAADMSNQQTNTANHNDTELAELIGLFSTKRYFFMKALKNLDDTTQEFVSMHPRLQEKMKPVDIAFFTAEHDDHHIASISSIIRSL